MIYIVNVPLLARVNRDHWCCECLITYICSADCDASDSEMMIGVIK